MGHAHARHHKRSLHKCRSSIKRSISSDSDILPLHRLDQTPAEEFGGNSLLTAELFILVPLSYAHGSELDVGRQFPSPLAFEQLLGDICRLFLQLGRERDDDIVNG